MNYKTLYLIVLILGFSLSLHSTLLTPLDIAFKDPRLLIDDTQFYIWDKSNKKIYICSQDDYKMVKELGGRGDGPGQFRSLNLVTIWNNRIYAASFPRLVIFSTNGKLIKELKGPVDATSFRPFENFYVGVKHPFSRNHKKTTNVSFTLYDANLQELRGLFDIQVRKKTVFLKPKMEAQWVQACLKHVVYDDKLIIGSSEGRFFFAIFDKNSDKLYEIDRPYKKIKVTSQHQQRIIADIKKRGGDSWWRQFTQRCNIAFPEYFPPYSDFAIEGEKLYVFKYPTSSNCEVLLLDLKGKLINKKIIMIKDGGESLKHQLGAFKNGKYYYLYDNPETETWELHSETIE